MYDPILVIYLCITIRLLFKIYYLYIYDKIQALPLLSLSCYELLYLFYHCLQDLMVNTRDCQHMGLLKRWFKTSERLINVP